jgi:hypothetical protein
LYSAAHSGQIRTSLVNADQTASDGGMGQHFFRGRDLDAALLPDRSHNSSKIIKHKIGESDLVRKLSIVVAPTAKGSPTRFRGFITTDYVATDGATTDYVATDGAGLASTSTRTVLIEPAASVATTTATTVTKAPTTS